MDLFTPEFKRLKARRPLPDFTEVIDINNIDYGKAVHKIVQIKLEQTDVKPVKGLKPSFQWKVFRFPDYPGFIIIKNPFLDGYQRYWVCRCLQDFSSDERNSTNLTNLGHHDCYDVWEDFVSRQCSTFSKDDRLRKLRWVTLGYHYGWDVKEYSEDRKAEFPQDVQCLSQYFSHCLGFGPFRAEAGIVNYYHLDSTLGGHTDHSEIDHTAPLLSFSFGQTCVFLLGGPTKETKPMAIYLHSGDVCVMSKAARLAYHAVPKILTPKEHNWVPPCFSPCNDHSDGQANISNHIHPRDDSISGKKKCEESEKSNSKKNAVFRDQERHEASDLNSDTDSNHANVTEAFMSEEYSSYIDTLNENMEKTLSALELEWRPFEVFLQSCRINMNLRQVLPPGYEAVEPQMEKYVSPV